MDVGKQKKQKQKKFIIKLWKQKKFVQKKREIERARERIFCFVFWKNSED